MKKENMTNYKEKLSNIINNAVKNLYINGYENKEYLDLNYTDIINSFFCEEMCRQIINLYNSNLKKDKILYDDTFLECFYYEFVYFIISYWKSRIKCDDIVVDDNSLDEKERKMIESRLRDEYKKEVISFYLNKKSVDEEGNVSFQRFEHFEKIFLNEFERKNNEGNAENIQRSRYTKKRTNNKMPVYLAAAIM